MADAFNVFNHPDFDTPNNNVSFFPNLFRAGRISAAGKPGNHPAHVGSARFLQLSLHLTF